jgi:hypothetical protein
VENNNSFELILKLSRDELEQEVAVSFFLPAEFSRPGKEAKVVKGKRTDYAHSVTRVRALETGLLDKGQNRAYGRGQDAPKR